MSLGREALKMYVELSLGHPAKAAVSARLLLEEDREKEEISSEDVYAHLLMDWQLMEIPESAVLPLWRWGVASPVSEGV